MGPTSRVDLASEGEEGSARFSGHSTTHSGEPTMPGESQADSAGPLLLRKGHCCRLEHVPSHP